MLVLDGADDVLRTYPSGLGFAPEGHKQFEGDGRTPEGSYLIDRRNPDSLFHLSIGISYPNETDIAFADAQGRSPGKDIFIHGGPRRAIDPMNVREMNVRDWTAGCISVTDRQVEEIYAMVQDGTPIDIHAYGQAKRRRSATLMPSIAITMMTTAIVTLAALSYWNDRT